MSMDPALGESLVEASAEFLQQAVEVGAASRLLQRAEVAAGERGEAF